MNNSLAVQYRVYVHRDPEAVGFWRADVEGLDGAGASSANLATLDRDVRQVIGLVENLPGDTGRSLSLIWEYRTGPAS